jgi:hypothetical protein
VRTFICVVAAAALTLGAPAAALADKGNPDYRSTVDAIAPPVKGLSISVLNFDDRLLLQNSSGDDVTVLDYQNKPYIRAAANGTVSVNTNSEAYYLNVSRFGDAPVPKNLPPTPVWKVVSRNGKYDWHDHRIHWMATANPPQVKDKSVKTKIDDWTVPIKVAGRTAAIKGTLTWVGKAKAPLPLGAIFAFAALVIVLSLGVFFVRRRRDVEGAGDEPSAAEAW